MTGLEGVILVVAFVGVGIPLWIFSLAVYLAAKRPRAIPSGERYFAYSRVLGFIHESMKTGEVDCGPTWVAAIRELREYPEYADLSILFLEEINVNGTKKFDRIMEKELKDVESSLLRSRHG